MNITLQKLQNLLIGLMTYAIMYRVLSVTDDQDLPFNMVMNFTYYICKKKITKEPDAWTLKRDWENFNCSC